MQANLKISNFELLCCTFAYLLLYWESSRLSRFIKTGISLIDFASQILMIPSFQPVASNVPSWLNLAQVISESCALGTIRWFPAGIIADDRIKSNLMLDLPNSGSELMKAFVFSRNLMSL